MVAPLPYRGNRNLAERPYFSAAQARSMRLHASVSAWFEVA
ncbi:MAG: hypothetical protein ACREED_04365 [Stellaceae bacterium]